jgi:PIN domain nuclease of toxin-antitoxin system
MILLDTNAILFLVTGHRRAHPLISSKKPLYVSPMSLLELELLVSIGRITAQGGVRVADVASDSRWVVDDVSFAELIDESLALSWTRDIFDRLITAHALRRGWTLATSDERILSNLPERRTLAL